MPNPRWLKIEDENEDNDRNKEKLKIEDENEDDVGTKKFNFMKIMNGK